MRPGEKLSTDELNTVVNSWHEAHPGHEVERGHIATLDRIGTEIGYGALAFIAKCLYEIQCHGDPKQAADMKRRRFQSLGWTLPEDFEQIAAK